MEDVTEMMAVAETLAKHTKAFQADLTGRTQKLEDQFKDLAKEMRTLKIKK
jgi:hypothetical protein